MLFDPLESNVWLEVFMNVMMEFGIALVLLGVGIISSAGGQGASIAGVNTSGGERNWDGMRKMRLRV